MKKIIGIFVISVSLLSCQPENRVYIKHQDLSPNVEWLKKDVQEFEVPIEDKSVAYDMSLSFRYATGFQYETANVKVTEISPNGQETIKEYKLKVREANGEYIGDPGLDIWDSEHLVESNKKYSETGNYKYVIEQNSPHDPMNYAMEIGLILDKK